MRRSRIACARPLPATGTIKYFGDGRALESYDLLARSAFVRVVTEHRRKFEEHQRCFRGMAAR